MQLLCFAKLLHGFVFASGYDFNHFSATETADSLDIDDHELRTDFLKSIAREQICTLVTTLTKHLRVTKLCAMLGWCLYPNNNQSVYDKFDDLFNRMDFDFSPELFQSYQLLENGWSDYADNN